MILKKEHELVKKSISDFCQRELYDTDLAEKMDREGVDMPQEFINKHYEIGRASCRERV